MSRHAGSPADSPAVFTLSIGRPWLVLLLAVIAALTMLIVVIVPVTTVTAPPACTSTQETK